MKVYLRANADHRPPKKTTSGFKRSPLLLPSATMPNEIHIKPATMTDAIDQLIDAGLLRRTREYVRPGACNATREGRAAEYEVLHRRRGDDPEGTPAFRFDTGDHKLLGMWRVSSENLRLLAGGLDGAALRILVCLVVPQHRDGHGECLAGYGEGIADATLQRHPRHLFNASQAAARLDIDATTARRALDELVQWRLVRVVRSGTGRRFATYEADGIAAGPLTFEVIKPPPRAPHPRGSAATGMVITGLAPNARQTPSPAT